MTLSTNGHGRSGHSARTGSRNGLAALAKPDQKLELKRGGFIASYPPFESLRPGSPEAIWEQRRLGLYVHLPYCRKRCTFCFYKVYTNQAAKPMDPYLNAVHAEIDTYAARPELHDRPVHTLYFGGGTPTTLSVSQMRALVGRLRRNFAIVPDAEFTCEGEPGTLNEAKVAALRELGVNRLSLGVQSFDDDILRKNGRSHGTAQVFRAVELARANDFPVINIDLMSGMVDETPESWAQTLETLIDLEPEHVSIYRMEVYRNSLLYAAGYTGPGVGGIPTDEEELELWLYAVDRLERMGYQQINGHAFIRRPEHDHVHRTDVWGGGDLLGMGVGSYSYLNGCTFQNAPQWDSYVKKASAGVSPVEKLNRLTTREQMAREVVLGIKMLRFDRATFQQRHGYDVMELYGPQIRTLAQQDLLEISDDAITVTRRGRIYVEIIGSVFYLPLHADYAFHRFATEDELARTAALQVESRRSPGLEAIALTLAGGART